MLSAQRAIWSEPSWFGYHESPSFMKPWSYINPELTAECVHYTIVIWNDPMVNLVLMLLMLIKPPFMKHVLLGIVLGTVLSIFTKVISFETHGSRSSKEPASVRNRYCCYRLTKLGEVALIVNFILWYCYVTNNSTVSVDFNNKHRLL